MAEGKGLRVEVVDGYDLDKSPIVEDYEEQRALESAIAFAGPVIHGFGRGSKQLGVPTANLNFEGLGDAVESLNPGIYYGWASVDGVGPFKMVMSIGWNPYFDGKQKTVEPHLLTRFASDFYDKTLSVVVTGYLRPEKNYDSLEALVAAIRSDIAQSSKSLDKEPHSAARTHASLGCAAAAAAAAAAEKEKA